jgi:HK97 gp10 family phage protein
MANTVSVQIDGLKELGAMMRNLSKEMQNKLAFSSTLAGAAIIKEEAKENLLKKYVYDTGALFSSVVIARNKKTPLTAGYEVGVSYKKIRKAVLSEDPRKEKYKKFAPYYRAIVAEYGNVNHEARPYLRPAFESKKEDAVRAIKDRLFRGIAKATK